MASSEPVQDPSRASLVEPGDLVAGKYRVERVVASGGMGVVVAARHEALDQRYAIKIMRPEILENEEAVSRFLVEARTAARLQSEHVARVFDVGRLEGGAPYMVMEYLDGVDLAALVGARGPLPIEEAVDYTVQTLEALAEAHASGIVHRDIKPSNLIVARRPDGSAHIKVLDFGISKHRGVDAGSAQAGLTSTQQVIGSPQYMSPEQIASPKSVDGRADIWAVGGLLFELCTGKPPFDGETVGAIMASILRDDAPRLRSLRADAPAGLEKVVRRCLTRKLDERYRDVSELAAALAPFGSSYARLSVRRIVNALGQATQSHTPAGGLTLPPSPPRSKGRIAAIAAGVLLCVALLGAGAWLGLRNTSPAPAPSASPVTEPAPPASATAAEARATATSPVVITPVTVDSVTNVNGVPPVISSMPRGGVLPGATTKPSIGVRTKQTSKGVDVLGDRQ